jgi:hypothetical protein
MRKFAHALPDLEEWYPQYFRQGNGHEPDVGDLRKWSLEHWPAQPVDDKWYGGWVRSYLFTELLEANRWAD